MSIGQFWVNGKGKGLLSHPFGYRKVALLIAKWLVALLQMEWNRVIHFVTNAMISQVRHQLISLVSTNRILVKHMEIGRVNPGRRHTV